jgi:hypothetical protein
VAGNRDGERFRLLRGGPAVSREAVFADAPRASTRRSPVALRRRIVRLLREAPPDVAAAYLDDLALLYHAPRRSRAVDFDTYAGIVLGRLTERDLRLVQLQVQALGGGGETRPPLRVVPTAPAEPPARRSLLRKLFRD